MRPPGATPILAGVSILAVLVGAAVGSASAATAGPSPVAAPPNAVSLSSGDAEEYWTPERLADAQPLELREGADTVAARSSDPGLLRASATTLKEAIVNSPAAYPNRVHGKIFGTYPGIGDYSCSGTVVTSKSGSLVTTAGHCVYDAGAGRSNQFASQLAFVPGYSPATRRTGSSRRRTRSCRGSGSAPPSITTWRCCGSIQRPARRCRRRSARAGSIQPEAQTASQRLRLSGSGPARLQRRASRQVHRRLRP